jgi:hypothetical protein
MSKFTTTIPVPVDAVLKMLPPNSFVNTVRIGEDKASLVVEWEQDEWRTPYTVPVEVSAKALANEEPLPETVKCKRVQNGDVAPTATNKAKKKQ